MNWNKILYWVGTAFMCAVFIFSASMYFSKTEMVKGFFTLLGFPTWIVIPLAIAKVAALTAILSRKFKLLMEWAYAGLFFDAILAFSAHYHANDNGYLFSVIAIIGILLSRIMLPKAFPNQNIYSVI